MPCYDEVVWVFNTKVAPFDDVRVRQALVMALDRRKFSEVTTGGLAKPATNPYGDGSWIKCSDDGALPHDLSKAKELIREYGKPINFKLLATATPRGRTYGQVFQQMWKEIRCKRRDRAGRSNGYGYARLFTAIPSPVVADH